MTSVKYKTRNSLFLRYIFSGAVAAGLAACGGGGPSEHSGQPHSVGPEHQLGEDELPDELTDPLHLTAGSQLFSLKRNGSGGNTSLATRGFKSNDDRSSDSEGLYVLDGAGKGKPYLKDGEFNRFHVIKDGTKTAYLARLKYDFTGKKSMKGGQWLIIKPGQKPIRISRQNENSYRIDPNFVGQTETNGWLAFDDGNFVDLNGKQVSFGKNIKNVTRVMYVSGDFAGIEREIQGNRVTNLVNVVTHKRKGYNNYFTPNFVQVTASGDGLLSDTNKSFAYGTDGETQISSLKSEIGGSGKKRCSVYKRNEIGNLLWFNGSKKIPNADAALVIGYVSDPVDYSKTSYYLLWVAPNAGGAPAWALTQLQKINDSDAHGTSHSSPFIQGEGFTIMRTGSNFLLITHATQAVTKLKTKFATLFDIRATDDLKKFVVLGETNNGDQFMRTYKDDGTFEGEVEIEIE